MAKKASNKIRATFEIEIGEDLQVQKVIITEYIKASIPGLLSLKVDTFETPVKASVEAAE